MMVLNKYNFKKIIKVFDLSYWLVWSILISAMIYGIHCYFEYRNHELDKRLEQLQNSK